MRDLKADDLDAAGTRKLADQKLSRKEEEEAIRRSDVLENDWRDFLRKVSRQEYIKKREQKKLDELRDDIEDEQYLFEGVKLTEAEYYAQRYKRELYELIKMRTEESDYSNEYRMSNAYDVDGGINQEKGFSVALQHYRDTTAEEKMNPFAVQEAWEEHQIGKATLKFGSKDKKQKHEDYEMAFCFSCCCLLKKIKKFLTRRLHGKQLNKEAETDIQTCPLVSECKDEETKK